MPGTTETYLLTDASGDRWTFHISWSDLDDGSAPHLAVFCNPSANARSGQANTADRPTDGFQLPVQLLNLALEHGVDPEKALTTMVGHQGPWPRMWPVRAPEGVLPPANGTGIPLPTAIGKLALNLLDKAK